VHLAEQEMTPKDLLLALSVLAAASAFAQAPLGTVTNVEGIVTATRGGVGVNVTPGTQIQDGMRFVASSRGSVTLQMNSGCSVSVPPGNGVTVLSSMTCAQLQAAVQPVIPVASQPTYVGANAADAAIALVGAGVAIGVLDAANNKENEIVPPPPISPQ